MEYDKPTIVLCDKRWLNVWQTALITFGMIVLGTATALLIALPAFFPDGSWVKLSAQSVAHLSGIDWGAVLLKNFDKTLILIMLIGQFAYMRSAQRQERLTLSADGISYVSPLPDWLKRFKPDWSLAWDQIQKAELGTFHARQRNPEFALLTLHSSSGKRQIFPAHWVDASSHTRPGFKFAFKLAAPTLEEILSTLMQSEVMRYMVAHAPHIPIAPELGRAELYTSLEKNPHGRKAIGIVALLILYAIVDFVAVPDSYVEQPSAQLPVFIAVGLIGAVLAWLWLSRSTLPMHEKNGLAILIGILAGVAMIPGALRINALTDGDGAITYKYYVTQGKDSVVLKPYADGMPDIDYFAKNAYWEKFGPEDTYPVQMRKGILGFYQFNSSVIVDELRKHER